MLEDTASLPVQVITRSLQTEYIREKLQQCAFTWEGVSLVTQGLSAVFGSMSAQAAAGGVGTNVGNDAFLRFPLVLGTWDVLRAPGAKTQQYS